MRRRGWRKCLKVAKMATRQKKVDVPQKGREIDWISPHKVSLLVLIKYLSCGSEEQENYTECIKRCGLDLSLLLLDFLQAPDLALQELCRRLTKVDFELPDLLLKSLHEVVEDGVSEISEFFQSLEKLFVGQEPSLNKKSLFGLFTRRMVLLFHKMTFRQVSRFVDLMQLYFEDHSKCKDGDEMEVLEDSSLDVSMHSAGMNEDAKNISTNQMLNLQGSVSNRQAEFFLAKQVSLMQSNETAAISPPELQIRITELLTASPDIAEAHYASFLNCLRKREFKEALDSLYHYFDRQTWSGDSASKAAGESDESEAERCHRFRYAALNLAALQCRFGHRQEALASLKEAIQIAQETNDHVCLEHCLGWLYRLEQDGSSQAKLLLDRFVARAAELKIPYLTSLGMLSHCQHDVMAGTAPPKVLQNLAQINSINSQNSLSDLMTTAHVQQAAMWQFYGKTGIATIFNQFVLQQSSASGHKQLFSVGNSSGVQSSEATCLSLCGLAEEHADQGMYEAASNILKFCKEKFSVHSNLSKLWMVTEAKIDHKRAVLQGDIERAQICVEQLAAVDPEEAKYRTALNMLHTGEFTAAFPLLQKLLEDCRDKVFINDGTKSASEFKARVLLAVAQLFLLLEDPVSALPYTMSCLTLSRSRFMSNMASLASLHIAQVQLLLGLPTKAVDLVKRNMVQILSHSSLYVQCCAQFLLVKCQLSASTLHERKKRKNDLLSALPTLDRILDELRKLNASNKTRDILYYKARIFDELGNTTERDNCAGKCCELLQSQPCSPVQSSLFVL